MRLVCPNCDAEYEVDASVIPDSGRDVQCSNCGHAWFQLPPDAEAEALAEAAVHDAPPGLAARSPAPEPEPEPEPVPAEQVAEDPEPEVEPAPAVADTVLRSIDDSVLAVLREEAAREVEARKAEAPPAVETQTEMSLPATATAAAARRVSRLKGEEEPVPPATRAERLPEVDELNSTLRASSVKRDGAAGAVLDSQPAKAPKKKGFVSGFTLMLLIAVLAAALYVMAPDLSRQFPAAEKALAGYVAAVDQARAALDSLVRSAVGFLRGLIGTPG